MQPTVFVDRVRDLLGTLAKAQKDYKTYPRNNPVLLKRREELIGKFQSVLAQLPELPLEVDSDELRYNNAPVYAVTDKRESIAFHLHRHGIREIRFVTGLKIEEMDAFIDAINTDLDLEASDDDLATVLWTRDLPHLRWEAVDDVEGAGMWVHDPMGALRTHLAAEGDAPRFADAIQVEGDAPARDPRNDLAAIDLSPTEVAQVRLMIQEDSKRDLAIQVIDILTSVLKSTSDPNEARNLLRILDRKSVV